MSTTSPDRWDADIPLPEPRSNRQTTRMHHVEYAVMRRLMRVLEGQDVETASRRMGSFMRNFGPMMRPVHQRGHANLRLVYPDMTAAERAAILRGVWENLGSTTAEYAHLGELPARVTIKGLDQLQEMIRSGQRAVYFSGHFANWEVMPATLFAQGLRFAAVYRAANNPLVDRQIIERRAEVMSRRLIPKGKRGARGLVEALNDGLSLCMLTDQKLNDGISVPLLGHDAMTAPAAARLALKDDLPLIPLQIVRHPGVRFTITIHPPLDVPRTGDRATDIEALTAAMNETLGRFILERPDQWLWLHRRWPRRVVG
jgi:KDO2-lipid IV(A) lauroyltransferase